jgi:hypothetical protein
VKLNTLWSFHITRIHESSKTEENGLNDKNKVQPFHIWEDSFIRKNIDLH